MVKKKDSFFFIVLFKNESWVKVEDGVREFVIFLKLVILFLSSKYVIDLLIILGGE